MSVTVLNTTASLSGKTLMKLEDSQTITGAKTFDLGASAPFIVISGSAKVDYLDVDKLDGETGADYHNATLLASGTVAIARGGTAGSATPTAGGIPYGTGTAYAFMAAGTAGQIPISGGAGAPTWGPTPTAGGVMYGGASTHAYTSAGTAGQYVTSGGAGAPTFLNPPLILKKGNSGTTTNVAAENVDTYAFSAAELTAKDTIIIEVTGEAVTQQTASVNLYNNTDAVAVVDVWDSGLGAMAAGREFIMTIKIRQLQSAATAIMSSGKGATDAAASMTTGGASTFATAWTGAWTLALRQGGVTAGGTFKWSWAVFVLKGQ